MVFSIKSYHSVGNLSFNDFKKDIRFKYKIFQSVEKDVKQGSNETSDMYEDFFIYYDENEKPKAFEFFGNVNISFEGQELLKVPYETVRNFFLKKDPNVILEEDGLTSLKYGIGIYCPTAYVIENNMSLEELLEEGIEQHPVSETVIVFRKNYYDGIY